jgi:hypothetical protein
MMNALPWFARFIVRDEQRRGRRFVELVFPLGLRLDARSFAELACAFAPDTSVSWRVQQRIRA